ncbi:hypothetical protein IWQ60_002935 [Tieghemiomyces parasiticus]|uniref:UBC core domain-containing protein n=1 Tax=Tieghemiomyces parasiticus TaxID=78921 RepID=A0A9W8ADV1_9FUNG|nr:hypothetical protein IWQ60_002935 [Tieghemiomyces parasiticus]
MSISKRRLTKELREIQARPPAGIQLLDGETLDRWTLSIDGTPDSLYTGERFTLHFRFGDNYPIAAPEVTFALPAPVHPHVYSNGHICLNILYDQWSPALTVEAVCLSLQSMLSSCTAKAPPADDQAYCAKRVRSPKQMMWMYHDDSV